MPAVNFTVRWPDGIEDQCYSPSTVLCEHFKSGQEMTLADFVKKADKALNLASERVAAKYGYHCSSASDQLYTIKKKANFFEDKTQMITITSIVQQS